MAWGWWCRTHQGSVGMWQLHHTQYLMALHSVDLHNHWIFKVTCRFSFGSELEGSQSFLLTCYVSRFKKKKFKKFSCKRWNNLLTIFLQSVDVIHHKFSYVWKNLRKKRINLISIFSNIILWGLEHWEMWLEVSIHYLFFFLLTDNFCYVTILFIKTSMYPLVKDVSWFFSLQAFIFL